jgi:nucleoid-associated protein YgaU
MGLIDFVKDAGARLLGRDDKDKEESTEVTEDGRLPTGPTLDDVRAIALRKAVESNDLQVTDLEIEVEGTKAKVMGKVDTREIAEKVVLCCGNTAGIAQVDDRLEIENPEPAAQFYTVVSGDSLSKIAKEYYGNAMKYPVIFEANKPMLSDPDKIYPGQVLRIPALSE